jgi:hypothetical protein
MNLHRGLEKHPWVYAIHIQQLRNTSSFSPIRGFEGNLSGFGVQGWPLYTRPIGCNSAGRSFPAPTFLGTSNRRATASWRHYPTLSAPAFRSASYYILFRVLSAPAGLYHVRRRGGRTARSLCYTNGYQDTSRAEPLFEDFEEWRRTTQKQLYAALLPEQAGGLMYRRYTLSA